MRTATGSPGDAPGCEPRREGAVARPERRDRRVVRAARDRAPARVPPLAVEAAVVEHEPVDARDPARAEIGGEPPPALGRETGVAAADHVERADRARAVGRPVRAHVGA